MDYTLSDRDRARFSRKHHVTNTGCWEWDGSLFQRTGYGVFSVKYLDGVWKSTTAHRVSYRLHKGEIPATFDIDHLCRNRKCVNPAHLEAVSRQWNFLRGAHETAMLVAMNRCPEGHEFTEANTYTRKSGKRECRACLRRRDNKRSGTRKDHYKKMYQNRKKRQETAVEAVR